MTTDAPIRRSPLALAITLALVLVSVVPTPAGALHQNCGDTYPSHVSRGNGHPNLAASGLKGWAGQSAVNQAEGAVFGFSSIKDSLLNGVALANTSADIIAAGRPAALKAAPDHLEPLVDAVLTGSETTARRVARGLYVSALVMFIAESSAKISLVAIGGSVANENACNDVLGGDMLDHIWVSIVQRNLASNGPPLATLLLPVDTTEEGGDSGEWPLQPQHEKEDFGWCPKIDVDIQPTPASTTDLDQQDGSDTGGDCVPGVHDGFLDIPEEGAPPRVTVEAIVRDTIDHAKAHGLGVRQAETHFQNAVTELDAGRWTDAFEHFRLAYQDAAGIDG